MPARFATNTLPDSHLHSNRRAATTGHAESMYRIGCLYDGGDGVEENEETAMDWWFKVTSKQFSHE